MHFKVSSMVRWNLVIATLKKCWVTRLRLSRYSHNNGRVLYAGSVTTKMSTSEVSSSTIFMLLPTSTMSSLQPSATPSPEHPTHATTVLATPMPLKQYVIILGVTTGVFLLTTILCTAILFVLCCRKLKQMAKKEATTDGVFDGMNIRITKSLVLC